MVKQPPINPSSFRRNDGTIVRSKSCQAREAIQQARGLDFWLRKKWKGNEGARIWPTSLKHVVQRTVQICFVSRVRRCRSTFVPKITRKYLKDKTGVTCVTVVPADGITSRGGLSIGAHDRFTRRTKEKFGRAHEGVFIGAVDWSMNKSKDKKHQPYWCQHVHGVTVADNAKTLKEALKKQFPSSPEIHRPIKVGPWDGSPRPFVTR